MGREKKPSRVGMDVGRGNRHVKRDCMSMDASADGFGPLMSSREDPEHRTSKPRNERIESLYAGECFKRRNGCSR